MKVVSESRVWCAGMFSLRNALSVCMLIGSSDLRTKDAGWISLHASIAVEEDG